MPNKLADAPFFLFFFFLICWSDGIEIATTDSFVSIPMEPYFPVEFWGWCCYYWRWCCSCGCHRHRWLPLHHCYYTYIYVPCVLPSFPLFPDFIFHFSFLSLLLFFFFIFCLIFFSKEIFTARCSRSIQLDTSLSLPFYDSYLCVLYKHVIHTLHTK